MVIFGSLAGSLVLLRRLRVLDLWPLSSSSSLYKSTSVSTALISLSRSSARPDVEDDYTCTWRLTSVIEMPFICIIFKKSQGVACSFPDYSVPFTVIPLYAKDAVGAAVIESFESFFSSMLVVAGVSEPYSRPGYYDCILNAWFLG